MLKFFDKDLDELELKFLGYFLVLVLGTIAIILKIDLITGFLGGIIAMMTRDLYRKETNTAKQGGKDEKGTDVSSSSASFSAPSV